ncbi:MAG: hypothetical protein CMP61_09835 [Flavobacteriales bacterium]|nr:hypothetical protein [Flavobacteriales bacterium]|tara:strand:+ start:9305 stop:9907 length:603 start_codon:yes stop_codon:yes gene_type:complete
MKNSLAVFWIIFSLTSCLDKNEASYAEKINAKRMFFESSFKGAESILNDSEKTYFKGLSYYKVDTAFLISAKISWNKNPKPVKLYTDSNDFGLHFPVVIFNFKIDTTSCKLIGYSTELQSVKKVFVPFYDRTNGDETYGGGRFMDVPLNNKEEAIIDFNLAYNPYCAYTKNYICPVPPLSNQLDIKIFAGEKRPLVEKHP